MKSGWIAVSALCLFMVSGAYAQDPGGTDGQVTIGERDFAEPGEFVRERYRWFFGQRLIPTGLPYGSLRAMAWEQAQRLPDLARQGHQWNQSPWEFFGPQQIENGWNGTPTAGQVVALAVDPFDPAILYAGAGNGGLWKSVDSGLSWTCISNDLPTSSSGAITIDPVDRNTIYYGTGEYTLSLNSYGGAGIFRSKNGGLTWEKLDGGALSDLRISEIVIDPTRRTTLYAATSRGIYKSTDGGARWTPTLKGFAQSLMIHPQDPSLLHATLGDPDGDPANGFYTSTDGGLTWKRAERLPAGFIVGRVEAALCKGSPNVIYLSFAAAPGGTIGTYKSLDGGKRWQRLFTAPDYGAQQSWYNNAIAVDPVNPDIVYLGGLSFWRSNDGGLTWSDRGRSYSGGGLHPDMHHLVVHPYDPQIVYAACDGGVYKSLDRGERWQSLTMQLANVEFYSLAVHPTNHNIVLGGTQDNGSLMKPEHSLFWRVNFWGDSGAVAFKSSDPSTLYIEYVFLELYRSRDSGATWQPIMGGLNRQGAQFVSPFITDPSNPSRLYAGSRVVSRSENEGDFWQTISPDWGSPINAIAVAPSDPRLIYAGLVNGRLYRTENYGSSWELCTPKLPARPLTAIAVSQSNPRRIAVTMGGFKTEHVYRSEDGGRTWVSASGNLPDVPVNTLLFHPDSDDAMIIGTDIGVFYSANSGRSWMRWTGNLPSHLTVLKLDYHALTRRVYIATHGRGIWRAFVPPLSNGGK
ncbi:MAG: hypothetical protein KIT45_11030 [Fimbriimonadia bacterium]|nr:hypothetical protein [Fimbriimonadia bacterium]